MSTSDASLGGFDDAVSACPLVPEDSDNDELAKRYPVGFTDYPFSEIGDIPYENAPIRLCWIIDWDRNKYATILLVGHVGIFSVKSGYLYKKPGRLGQVKSYTNKELDLLMKDRCELCHREKGGALGNENVVGGVVVCDYCHAAAIVTAEAAEWLI